MTYYKPTALYEVRGAKIQILTKSELEKLAPGLAAQVDQPTPFGSGVFFTPLSGVFAYQTISRLKTPMSVRARELHI